MKTEKGICTHLDGKQKVTHYAQEHLAQHTPTPFKVNEELLAALKHDHETLAIYRKSEPKDSLCSVCKLIAKAEGK